MGVGRSDHSEPMPGVGTREPRLSPTHLLTLKDKCWGDAGRAGPVSTQRHSPSMSSPSPTGGAASPMADPEFTIPTHSFE